MEGRTHPIRCGTGVAWRLAQTTSQIVHFAREFLNAVRAVQHDSPPALELGQWVRDRDFRALAQGDRCLPLLVRACGARVGGDRFRQAVERGQLGLAGGTGFLGQFRRWLAQGTGQAQKAPAGAHAGQQFAVGHGPGDIAIRARVEAVRWVFRRAIRIRHQHHETILGGRVRFDPTADLDPVDSPQIAIEQHQIRDAHQDALQRFLPVGRLGHGVALFFEEARRAQPELGVVIQHQNADLGWIAANHRGG